MTQVEEKMDAVSCMMCVCVCVRVRACVEGPCTYVSSDRMECESQFVMRVL